MRLVKIFVVGVVVLGVEVAAKSRRKRESAEVDGGVLHLAPRIRSSKDVRCGERNSSGAEVPEACIHRISIGELGEVSAKDPLDLSDAAANVTGTVIQNEVNMKAWIVAEQNIVLGPCERVGGTGRELNPPINVLAAWIQVEVIGRRAGTRPYVIHVEALGSVVVPIGLVNQFVVGKCAPVNAEDAAVAREPIHGQNAIAYFPICGV